VLFLFWTGPKITVCPNCTSTRKINPTEELSTGLEINLLEHPKANLVPKFPDCGPTPEILSNVIASTAFTDGAVLKRVKRVVGGRPFGLGSLSWMAQIYARNSKSPCLYHVFVFSNKSSFKLCFVLRHLPGLTFTMLWIYHFF